LPIGFWRLFLGCKLGRVAGAAAPGDAEQTDGIWGQKDRVGREDIRSVEYGLQGMDREKNSRFGGRGRETVSSHSRASAKSDLGAKAVFRHLLAFSRSPISKQARDQADQFNMDWAFLTSSFSISSTLFRSSSFQLAGYISPFCRNSASMVGKSTTPRTKRLA
jgi:hypothetical protein